MTELLVGGGVGVVGTLVGLVYGLWQRNKYLSEVKSHKLLQGEYNSLEDDYRKLNETHVSVVAKYAKEISTMRKGQEQRDEEVRRLISTCRDPSTVTSELNRMFPPVPKT